MPTDTHEPAQQPNGKTEDGMATAFEGIRRLGETQRSFAAQGQTAGAEAAGKLQELAGGSVRYGQEAVARQAEVLQALASARTPEDLARLQVDYGRKVFEAYVAEVRRVSDLFADMFLASARLSSQQAEALQNIADPKRSR